MACDMKWSPIWFVLLGLGAGIFLLAGGWAAAVFAGPMMNMEQNNALSKSSLNYYSKKTFMVETLTLACLMGLVAACVVVYIFFPKQWLSLITYILIGLSIIAGLTTVGYFGYTYFSMRGATNKSMVSSLALWEEKFGCCGWDDFRPQPLCASEYGSVSKTTCQKKLQPMLWSCLQNFAIGTVFLVLLIATLIAVIVSQVHQPKKLDLLATRT
ncbi:hypothetical protein EIN_226110 [Entamoeba invadens IP1]|uniref:Uncharacterized protein n=1 Tax=Entamoeba invadens IP1 TaxID=370355 RepID=A0A0A1U8E1_ENTIV|nr:hypothetical protein EIN_226110 [Entamoeba invadens IP1]ELP88248.1 hypothetical protein EIN_226110 [Entamoeba invadens IP1]|eukprot:XP_004255019.1 hypothetical protein EIN_226110 [Entamoeba invadens IP1]